MQKETEKKVEQMISHMMLDMGGTGSFEGIQVCARSGAHGGGRYEGSGKRHKASLS